MGPIVAFFSFSTTSYPFMLLLNVLVFTVSGLLGMAFLLADVTPLEHCLAAGASLSLPRAASEPGEQDVSKRESDPIQAELAEEPGAHWTGWRATCSAGT